MRRAVTAGWLIAAGFMVWSCFPRSTFLHPLLFPAHNTPAHKIVMLLTIIPVTVLFILSIRGGRSRTG